AANHRGDCVLGLVHAFMHGHRPASLSCSVFASPQARGPGVDHLMALDELRLLKHFGESDLATIDGYERVGGYKALRKALLEMESDEVLHELEESGLRGRGGAGFAMGKKASFLPKGSMDKYLCCNADESEPGAFKDRLLLQRNPHQLIEGILIGAVAAGANRAFI